LSLPAGGGAVDEIVYRGHDIACVRLAREPGRTLDRYAIVREADHAVLGELRWQGSQRRYVLVPRGETAWCSGWLCAVALWLRRLTRSSLGARQP
jgi:hypothetical protein